MLYKELEKDNMSLVSKRQQLHEQNELLANRVRKLQSELEKSSQNESKAKQKLEDQKKEIIQANGRIAHLTEQVRW